MKPGTVAAIKKQLGLSEIGMRAYPAALTPDPDGGFTVTFRNVPEAITEGDTRDEALLPAEDALESALAMYVAAKEPLPTSSEAGAGEVMVPLSALGMAKNALYDAMREQGVGHAELTRRLRWHLPLVNRVLDLRHASRMEYVEAALAARLGCASSSTWREPYSDQLAPPACKASEMNNNGGTKCRRFYYYS